MEAQGAGTKWPYVLAAAALPLALGIAYLAFPEAAGRLMVVMLSPRWAPVERGMGSNPEALHPGSADPRDRVAVQLVKVADGLTQPTDVQFFPDSQDMALVLERHGTARWLSVADGSHGVLFDVPVATVSEQGLLGLAFHPAFATNNQFFINYVAGTRDGDFTRIERWEMQGRPGQGKASASMLERVLEVRQPYQNHNAGQLAFGPDGYLYIGLGDGGLRADPAQNGQNPDTLLGSMLRIDVDRRAPNLAYAIPHDNPFVGKPGHRPELWAYGLRNPWRFSFDPQGRLIVADVGQDRFEEIDIVPRGGNMGWALREGFNCFPPDRKCGDDEPLVEPIAVYGRDQGVSVTGGYVYTGEGIPNLRQRYVFGDFVSGRLWALTMPSADAAKLTERALITLGQWSILPSTFGRDAAGELYVADYAKGVLYRITASGDAPLDAGTNVADASTAPPQATPAAPDAGLTSP